MQVYNYSRHAIGYVVQGTKYLYDGDNRKEIRSGDIFYMSIGNHYVEDVPDNKAYEQIIFYYTSEQLNRILTNLSATYGLFIKNDHSCANCSGNGNANYSAWNVIKDFFGSIDLYIKEGLTSRDGILEAIKMSELVYHIITNPDCCVKRKILQHSDSGRENFEQIIHDNIFKDVSLETIAALCNKSITSFKKEFKKHFYESPHKWFVKQRLIHARLLLIASSKSIADISSECSFQNASHFIKLFKNEFGMTPAVYRNRYTNENTPEETPLHEDAEHRHNSISAVHDRQQPTRQ